MENMFALLGTFSAPGLMTAISAYVVLCFLNIRRVCGYHVLVDVLFSLALIVAYSGTFAGMVTAFLAGLFLSFLLYFTRLFLGYETWSYKDGWVYHVGWW